MADDKYPSLRALDAVQGRSLEGKKEYVASLEARGDEQALSLLVECLCDESPFLRDLAEQALGRLGGRGVEVLLPHLAHGLWFTRASVARVLGGLGAREAVGDLMALTGDANRSVSEAAREAVVRVAAAGHVVRVARALFRAPAEIRQPLLALAERSSRELAAQLGQALADQDLMTAEESEVVGEGPRLVGPQEGVEWELLTGRESRPGSPVEPRDEDRRGERPVG